ncbi:hypothetical protein [Neorhizobium petrolearium]|uniref:Uncharacterized protein n=1 Tax=Neorhizobium petrolearium TaxID=515361 RepID=A0ABY8M8N6_9HYPH|nr:hypothetical protein [Neorhizobium petrolearium]MCC2610783.1 hypothetical protein [Neorhizobium petrolearium]WGI70905.1 hypothetical protein QEO92_13105 [Neorhizobium petrolearium]
MLSAQALSVSLQSIRPGGVWRAFGRYLRQLVRPGLWRVPKLPVELRSDVGLGEALPSDRAEAFWEAKRRSCVRDLPL